MFSALMRATLHGFGTAHSSNPIEIKKRRIHWSQVVQYFSDTGMVLEINNCVTACFKCFGDANKFIQDYLAPLK